MCHCTNNSEHLIQQHTYHICIICEKMLHFLGLSVSCVANNKPQPKKIKVNEKIFKRPLLLLHCYMISMYVFT